VTREHFDYSILILGNNGGGGGGFRKRGEATFERVRTFGRPSPKTLQSKARCTNNVMGRWNHALGLVCREADQKVSSLGVK